MKINTLKKDNNIYFYVWLPAKLSDERRYKKGIATYIRYDSWDKNWDVYRTTVTVYSTGVEFGNGWNLYQNLTKSQAIGAAKNALKILIQGKLK